MAMNKKAAGLRPFIINLMLVIIFAVFIIFFALQFIAINNPSSQILQQSHINNSLSNLNKSINDFSNSAGNIFGIMGSSNPTPTDYLFLIFRGAFEIPYAFLSFAGTSIFNLGNLLFNVFGGGLLGGVMTIAIGFISAVLTVTLVLYIVKAIRTGESDH